MPAQLGHPDRRVLGRDAVASQRLELAVPLGGRLEQLIPV
jgi:hypothetical protein